MLFIYCVWSYDVISCNLFDFGVSYKLAGDQLTNCRISHQACGNLCAFSGRGRATETLSLIHFLSRKMLLTCLSCPPDVGDVLTCHTSESCTPLRGPKLPSMYQTETSSNEKQREAPLPQFLYRTLCTTSTPTRFDDLTHFCRQDLALGYGIQNRDLDGDYIFRHLVYMCGVASCQLGRCWFFSWRAAVHFGCHVFVRREVSWDCLYMCCV